jgi:hypothetical protein
MIHVRSIGVATALLATACGTTAPGLMRANEPSYIASVEVVQHDASAPPAFAEALRRVMLEEAAPYGDAGRAITLKIDVEKVHFKNMLQAMLIGDNNDAKGKVAVIDASTGQQAGAFPIEVDAERPGSDNFSFASAVLGAFDPTGLVSIGAAAGSAASADIDRAGTTGGMILNFAAQTLRWTFGDAKVKAVEQARQAKPRPR